LYGDIAANTTTSGRGSNMHHLKVHVGQDIKTAWNTAWALSSSQKEPDIVSFRFNDRLVMILPAEEMEK
jgi:hypothetical protein